jgi:hypothetical protein
MKFILLFCTFIFFNNFKIIGQDVNLYFETENGKYDFSNIGTINASIFSNKIVVLKVRNKKEEDTFKISSNGGIQLIKLDSIIGNIHVIGLKFNRLITEDNKKIFQERDSQTILLSLQVIKYRKGQFIEIIPIKVSLRITH